jgi:AcrR family transcriptional regulator
MQLQLIDEHAFPRVPQQARSRAKREALMAAALDLFGYRGYEAVSIEMIVTEAGSSVGTFYSYFRSKQQILLVLVQRYLDTLLALDLLHFDDELRPLILIERGIQRALVPDKTYAGLWRAWREAVMGDADLAVLDQQITAWAREYVVQLLQQLQKRGSARTSLDLPSLATIINELMWQLAQRPQIVDDAIIATTALMVYHSIFQDD